MGILFQRSVLFFWLVLASGAGMALYTGLNEADTAAGGGLFIQVTYSLIYLFFFVLVAMGYRTIVPIVLAEKWVVLLWLWVVASTAWSVEPSLTLRRSIALLGSVVIGLYVATRFDLKGQLRILGACITIVAIASLAFGILYPDLGITTAGEWKGVFYHKNVLGHTMALGIFCMCFLAMGAKRTREKLLFLVLGLLCGGLLVLSHSVTALAVCIVMLTVLKFRKVFKLPSQTLTIYALGISTIAIPAGIWFFSNLDAILRAVGRDPTLTGRTPLWHAVVHEIGKRPLTGYGYTAFWYSPEGDRVHAVLGWLPMHSHNGYLETTLALGFIGLALLLIGLLANLARGVDVFRSADSIEDFWPLFFLIFAAVDNIAETWMVKVNSLIWMLYLANTYWIVRAMLEARAAQREETQLSEYAPLEPAVPGH
jgi:O-antigen ligase